MTRAYEETYLDKTKKNTLHKNRVCGAAPAKKPSGFVSAFGANAVLV
jgi:hypothetical protein